MNKHKKSNLVWRRSFFRIRIIVHEEAS